MPPIPPNLGERETTTWVLHPSGEASININVRMGTDFLGQDSAEWGVKIDLQLGRRGGKGATGETTKRMTTTTTTTTTTWAFVEGILI